MNLVLQISVVVCLGLGWNHKGYGRNLDTDSDATPYDIESTRLKEYDGKSIHYHVGLTAIVFVIIYIATFAIRLLGLLIPRIYSIFLIGYISRLLRSRRFGNTFRHWIDVLSLIAVVSGYSQSISLVMEPFDVKTMEFNDIKKFHDWFDVEQVYILTLVTLAILSSVLISIVGFQVHKRQYHDSSLSYQVFKNYDLSKFAKIYEERHRKENIGLLPKMTTPARKY